MSIQDLTFEHLCGVLRAEFGSAPVSSPAHPRVGDGDPLTGDLILREDGPFFVLGAQDRGHLSELARFSSESEACRFILGQIGIRHRPGIYLGPAEKAGSERITRDVTEELRRTQGL